MLTTASDPMVGRSSQGTVPGDGPPGRAAPSGAFFCSAPPPEPSRSDQDTKALQARHFVPLTLAPGGLPCTRRTARRAPSMFLLQKNALAPAFLLGLLMAIPVRADTVTGTVRNQAGLAVAGATVDIYLSSGSGGTTTVLTGATGVFSAVIAGGTYTLEFRPTTASGLAPKRMEGVVVAVTTNVGIVTLLPGFAVSGTVRNSAGVGLVSADINVYEVATGAKLFTPNDLTIAGGAFSVIVPAGLYNVRAAPPAGQILVAQLLVNVTVAAATNLGIIVLPPGVILSGTVVTATTGAPLASVDLDVDDAVTGQRIQTPGDNTNAAGVFSVIVPTGTFTVSFDPLPGVPWQGRRVFNVAVPGTTTMGIVQLQAGWIVTGSVRGPGNVPVVNADLDVDTLLGGVRLYTSNDSTAVDGTLYFVLKSSSLKLRL